MGDYCQKHHTYHGENNCPICKKQKLLIVIPIMIVVIVGAGFFGYLNYDNYVDSLFMDMTNEINNLEKTDEIQMHNTEKEWRDIMKKDYTVTETQPNSVTKADIEKYKKEIHRLINEERVKVGLVPLTLDSKINKIAQGYSEYMAKNDHFAHKDLDGNSSDYRLSSTCSGWKGENLLLTSSVKNGIMPKNTVNGWVNSEGHAENIFDSEFRKHGLGITINDKEFHNVYIVSNFC